MKHKLPQNKWFYAFAVATLLFIAAAVVAIVIGVLPEDDVVELPEYTEGAETGVYYYDVQDNEIILTLSGGNNFTIASNTLNKSGTYTADANGNLTLDFVKDEDGTTTATVSGNTVKLVYNNATMTFLKKINYNVTFSVDGGSEIPGATVLNGKTVAEPTAEPTKDGYAFIGWYTDSAFTTRFDFNTAITADTTVVARWVPLTVGEIVYNVDFYLGYEGAPTYSEITTIGGNVYNVPTPKRDGYKFVGWYVSMYEDAEKLSYAYTESTKFTADTTLFAVWESEDATLAAPQASVSSSAISWSPVAGATSYKVTVADENGITVINKSVGTTSESFDFAEHAAGEYTVTVTAVTSDGTTSEACTRYYANKTLDRVSKMTVVDGIFAFAPVAGATKYTLTVDCANANHDHSKFDNGTSNTFDLSNCGMKKGGVKITVTASAAGYADSVSEVFVYEKNLSAIENIIYSAATDRIVWDVVNGAFYYTVTVTQGEETDTYTNVGANYFSLSAYTGDITVTVVPVSAGYNSPEAATATYTKAAPATPTGVTVSGTTISWNAAEGAESYEIKIGDKSTPVEGTSVDLTSLVELTPNGRYEISVKAVKGTESSLYSEPATFAYRTMSHDLIYKNGVVYWTPVIDLSEFEVKVNGGAVKTVTNATHCEIELTKAGVNTIEVRCVADRETSEWAVIKVYAYEVTYMSRTTQGELTEYVAIGDELTLPEVTFTLEGYEFAGWFTAPNGNGTRAAKEFDGNKNTLLYANWAPKTYNIKLNLDDDKLDGAPETTVTATYTKGFYIPPVESLVEYTDDLFVFTGWYTGPSGTGIQLTDENGYSIADYAYTRDTVAYPAFASTLTFTLQKDGTYAVSKGAGIKRATTVTIPETYEGKPVTVILENGFDGASTILSVNIPNTIELVGADAFAGCRSLKEINVYGDENPDAAYSSFDGALIRKNVGQTWLEMFPRAKMGDYIIPEGVTAIRNKAFNKVSIETVTIGKDVVNIPDYSFYDCSKLNIVYFEGDRSYTVAIGENAFFECEAIESIRLPYELSLSPDDLVKVLNTMPALKTVNVEARTSSSLPSTDSSAEKYYYASIDGILVGESDGFLYFAPPAKEYGESYTIPNGITNVYKNAFAGASISKVVIPTVVKSIGEGAFSGSTLTELVFSENRVINLDIAEGAFANCEKLASIVFNANTLGGVDTGSVTIGKAAFAPKSDSIPALTEVSFGAGVNIAAIGTNAFAGQYNLASLTYGENCVISEIGERAFENCAALTEIIINASTSKIGNYAYSGCEKASKVEFKGGSNAIEFGKYIFSNCIKLSEVSLPATLKSFDGSIFNGCYALKKVEVAEGNPYYKNDENGILYNIDETELIFYPRALLAENDGVVVIKEGVTTISASAFNSAQGLKVLTLPSTITAIGNEAFANCAYLESVTFVTGTAELTIGDSAFANCFNLNNTNFTLPANTISIGEKAFYACGFTAQTLPEGLTYIGDLAFAANQSLASVSIPGTVTYLGNGAFAGCLALEAVEFKNGTEALELGTLLATEENGVFYNCDKLTAITLPARTTVIGAYAFTNTSLTSINIPKNVTAIGRYAFAADKAATLNSITFEEGGEATLTIGEYAFAYQTGVAELVLPYRTAALGGVAVFNEREYSSAFTVFYGMTGLKNIKFGAEVDGLAATYTSVDGVLYALDDKGVAATLLYCPTLNEGTNAILGDGDATVGYELVIPNYVTLVANGALHDVRVITKLTFEEFESTNENYGKPLLDLGTLDAVDTTWDSGNQMVKFPYELMVIGGKFEGSEPVNSIAAISLPSHLNRLTSGSIGRTAAVADLRFNLYAKVSLSALALPGASVKEIRIGTVTEMGAYTFKGVYDTETIYIGTATDNATEFPYGAISSADSIQAKDENGKYYNYGYYVPGGISSPADFALKTVYIPKGITSFAGSAFLGAKNLEEVIFEDASTVTYFGNLNFSNNTAMTYFPFDEMTGLVTIDNTAFQGCKGLTSIDFSNCVSLTSIGNSSFGGCTSLTSIVLPPNIKTLGTGVFNGCTSFTTVHFSKGFTAEMLTAPFFHNESDLELGNASTSNITTVTVDSENPELIADTFGAIYDKEMTILYYFPAKGDIANYTIPETVTAIAPYAFANVDFSGYEKDSFVIPEGVERIEKFAFAGIYRTEGGTFDLYLPSTLEYIGEYAFFNTTRAYTSNNVTYLAGIDNVYITDTAEKPSKLKEIGQYAFSKSSMTSINIPDNVADIGESAFASSKLTSLTVPSALVEIPKSFANSAPITSLTIQNGTEIIGESAFGSCSSLTEVFIPASVTEIKNGAFGTDSKLASVTFDENSKLTTIGNLAFRYTGITEIVLPASLENMGTEVFTNCSSLVTADLSKTKLTEIPAKTFNSAKELTTVSFPAGLKVIDDNAFNTTSALKEITLPDTLEEIGASAFKASALTAIAIPDSVTSIGASAFESLTTLKSVTFGANSKLKELGSVGTASNIFKGTTALETVTLGNNLTLIGDSVFENSAVSTVALADSEAPSQLLIVGNSAFSGCANLQEFKLLDKVTHIYEYAFYGCSALKNTRPALGLKFFGGMAFGNCTSLTSSDAYIPQSVTELTGNPYTGCSVVVTIDKNDSLNEQNGILYDATGYTVLIVSATATGNVTLLDSVYEISAGAFAGTNISGITIPSRIKEISESTFANCTSLESVVFENGVETIGNYAFQGCTKLTSVTFGNTLSSIGTSAFEGCTMLDNVTIPKSVVTLGSRIFANCTALTTFSFEERGADDTACNVANATYMFTGCTSLAEFVFPNKHAGAKIPNSMFEGSGIKTAVIPATITDLSSTKVFKDCKSLKSVEFAGDQINCTDIGGYYFYGCSALEEITIPYNATTNTSAVRTVLPSKTGYVFAECTSLKTVTIYSKRPLRSGKSSMLVSNSTSGAQKILKGNDAPYMFLNCTSLEEVNVYWGKGDDAVTGYLYPGKYYFKGCTNLKYAPVIMDAGTVYEYAFEGATSVTDIYMDMPYYIGAGAFKGCTSANAYFTNVKKSFKYTDEYRKNNGVPITTNSETATFGAKMFDGWTAEQSIYFLNNTEAEITAAFGSNWLAGCEAKVYYKDDIANLDSLDVGYLTAEFWTNENLKLFTGATELNIGTVYGKLTANLFEGTAFTTIKFTEYTSEELAELLAGDVLAGCTATILDKDGVQYVPAAEE